jgi:hypothetical protein
MPLHVRGDRLGRESGWGSLNMCSLLIQLGAI